MCSSYDYFPCTLIQVSMSNNIFSLVCYGFVSMFSTSTYFVEVVTTIKVIANVTFPPLITLMLETS